ncbi:MAG: ATP synthase F1 subunit delta [Chloroflexi bacterium]|nr:ATP synthase F1 subunit delta [Chloroflexota bacterium]
MAGESLARRYAQAAFELALEVGEDPSEWVRDLRTLARETEEPALATILQSPRIPFSRKREIIGPAIEGLPRLRQNLILAMVENGRTASISRVAQELQRRVNDLQGVVDAEVTTAIAIDEGTAEQIGQLLGKITGKRVTMQRRVDPSILGGLIARVEDSLINASVAGRLNALRDQLT